MNSTRTLPTAKALISYAAAAVCLTIGLTVLCGWIFDIPGLTRVKRSYLPMPPTGAAAFSIFGIALIWFLTDRPRRGIAALTGIGGVVFASFFVGSIRIPVNGVICWSLTIGALLSFCRNRMMAASLLASIVFAIGIIGLLGYISGVNTSLWGNFNEVPLLGTVGFVTIGIGVSSLILHRVPNPPWLPIPIFIGVLTASLALWNALRSHEDIQFQRAIRQEGLAARNEIANRFEARVSALQRLAKQWEHSGPPKRNEWEHQAGLIHDDYPGFQFIQWADDTFHVRWIAPPNYNPSVEGLDLLFENNRRIALHKAKSERQPIRTGTLDLVIGGRGFLAIVPIYQREKFEGVILGVFRIESFFDSVLDETYIAKGYGLSILEFGREIYLRDPASRSLELDWGQTLTLGLYGVPLTLKIWPQPEVLAGHYSVLPLFTLVFGGIAGALISLILHLGQRARRARDELDRRVRERTADLAEVAESQKFLSEATALMSATLDYEATLQKVVRLAVPRLADACAVQILEADGSIRSVALHHREPEKVPWVQDWVGEMCADSTAWGVFKTGRPDWIADLTEDRLARMNPAVAKAMRRLGLRSVISVPLIAGGRVLGTLVFARAGADRSYGPADLSVAEDLASRAALAIENARLYEQSKLAVKARDEFLSIASHELRTPLTSHQLQLQGILRSLGKNDPSFLAPERLTKALTTIKRQGDRLSRLINDLLDISRITAGRLNLVLEECDLAEITRSVVEQNREDAVRSGTIIRVTAGHPVRGRWDRTRLEQVVTNLLSNAIKYGGGKPISMSVESQDGTARLIVHDEGIGIAPADQNRLFQPFERAVPSNHYGGLGMGLYIIRQIVEAHGGKVGMKSAEGRGSTFTVDIPLSPPN